MNKITEKINAIMKRKHEQSEKALSQSKTTQSGMTLSEMISDLANKKYILVLLSIILSMILWAVITQKTDSHTTITVQNIPIDFEKSLEDTPAEMAHYKIYNPDTDKIDIKVTVKRTEARTIGSSKYYARVTIPPNLYLETPPVFVNLKVYSKETNEPVSNVEIPEKKIQVYFYKEIVKEITPQANTNPIATDNYKPNSVSAESIQLIGPDVILNKINSCTFKVDPENKVRFDESNDKMSFVKYFDISDKKNTLSFYDSDKKDITDEVNDYIQKNYISFSKNRIGITFTWQKKLQLDITYEITNQPSKDFDDSFIRSRLSVEPSSITVWSRNEALNDMTTLPVAADENIPLNTINRDFSTSFSISKALENFPDLSYSGNEKNCVVKFDSTNIPIRTFDDVKNFVPQNPYQRNFNVQVITECLNGVQIFGPTEEVNSIQSKDLTLMINISKNDISGNSEISDSTRTYPVTISVPSQYKHVWAVGDYQADVIIKELTDDNSSVHP